MDYSPQDLSDEIILATDMRQFGKAIFEGATDIAMRRKRARDGILSGCLASRIRASTSETRPERFLAAFERVYHEPLHVEHTPIEQPEEVTP